MEPRDFSWKAITALNAKWDHNLFYKNILRGKIGYIMDIAIQIHSFLQVSRGKNFWIIRLMPDQLQ